MDITQRIRQYTVTEIITRPGSYTGPQIVQHHT